ncbi:tyrosine tRNA ligase [Mycena crocata]|nr:tyrosine tRNA ligase [Mycena crocata]
MSSAEEKYELITRRLQEILGGDIIKGILAEGRTPKGYWGTAPTGRPHIGYIVPLTKMADLLRADTESSDLHAFLDNMKAPIELVQHRTNFQRARHPDLQIEIRAREFNMDTFRMCVTVTEHDAKKAGAEVVKQVENPLLSGLLYPALQALDEQYLGADFQFGGIDQRKIFTFSEQYLPRLGYAKRAHLMNAMVPGLAGGKMSSSDPNSKIDFVDAPEVVRKKIKAAFCEEGKVADNGILSFVEARDEKFGRSSHYKAFEDLRDDFAEKKLHPKDLKTAVTNAINRLLDPIRKAFAEDEEIQKIEKIAYPDLTTEKKAKKPKTYHPPPPGQGKSSGSAAPNAVQPEDKTK